MVGTAVLLKAVINSYAVPMVSCGLAASSYLVMHYSKAEAPTCSAPLQLIFTLSGLWSGR